MNVWTEGGPAQPLPYLCVRCRSAMPDERGRMTDYCVACWPADPLWMRVVARLSTADWWAIGTAAMVGAVGGLLVGVWYR